MLFKTLLSHFGRFWTLCPLKTHVGPSSKIKLRPLVKRYILQPNEKDAMVATSNLVGPLRPIHISISKIDLLMIYFSLKISFEKVSMVCSAKLKFPAKLLFR